MSAPKSDEATIQARRARLLELLADGMDQAGAAAVLREEGFPADRITVWRDVKSFDLPALVGASEDMQAFRAAQLEELAELRLALRSPSIRDDKKVSLALEIIDREIKLLGTAAPTRSMSLTAKVDGDPAAARLKASCAGLSPSQLEHVMRYAAALPRAIEAERDETWMPKKELGQ